MKRKTTVVVLLALIIDGGTYVGAPAGGQTAFEGAWEGPVDVRDDSTKGCGSPTPLGCTMSSTMMPCVQAARES